MIYDSIRAPNGDYYTASLSSRERDEWLNYIITALGYPPGSLSENREIAEQVLARVESCVAPSENRRVFLRELLEEVDSMTAKSAVSDEAVFSSDQIAALHRMIDGLKRRA